MKKKMIKLTENKLRQIVSESVKNVLNEISSDLLDKAKDAAENKGRIKQSQNFQDGANERRKQELNPNDENSIVSMHINPKRDVCVVQDGNRRLSVYANGTLKSVEDHTFSSNPDFGIISWPLDYENKLSSKISRQLARVIVKWCDKYLSPEGKEKLQGYEDYHNWIQL